MLAKEAIQLIIPPHKTMVSRYAAVPQLIATTHCENYNVGLRQEDCKFCNKFSALLSLNLRSKKEKWNFKFPRVVQLLKSLKLMANINWMKTMSWETSWRFCYCLLKKNFRDFIFEKLHARSVIKFICVFFTLNFFLIEILSILQPRRGKRENRNVIFRLTWQHLGEMRWK